MILVLGVLLTGGTAAYLTDYDETINEFTIGKVEIELQEPNWNPQDHTKMEPGDSMEKDPQIKNTGMNDAFVYMEISVPVRNVITAAEDGTRTEQKEQELFSFSINEGWTKIREKKAEDSKIYVYTYNRVLKPEETTKTLFDQVTFVNIIEGQLDTQQLEIPVRAYAIQTANTGGDSGSVIEQAKNAYEKYVNQNLGEDGQAAE